MDQACDRAATPATPSSRSPTAARSYRRTRSSGSSSPFAGSARREAHADDGHGLGLSIVAAIAARPRREDERARPPQGGSRNGGALSRSPSELTPRASGDRGGCRAEALPGDAGRSPAERSAPAPSARARAQRRATRATCPSLIAGKNGSASEREATSSHTGNCPSLVAEALAVEAHEVNRRQVGLALDAFARERCDHRARDRRRAGSWTTNTNHPRRARRRRPRRAARPPRPRPAPRGRATRRARARSEHLVEPRQLREPERARELREPVVEAEPIVVEPAHVRAAPLVALGVDQLLERRSASVTMPALAGRELLVRVEAEDARMPASADRPARPRNARRAPRRRPRRSPARAAAASASNASMSAG